MYRCPKILLTLILISFHKTLILKYFQQVLDVSSTTSSPQRCGGNQGLQNPGETSASGGAGVGGVGGVVGGVGGAKRGRPTKNPCWSYFSRLDDDRVVKCNLCGKVRFVASLTQKKES